jgi:pimeloyl-ACP methyl ester carboxylesterase
MDALKRFPAGLFFLDEYDPLRVPVLFIHGMSGTARDFAAIIERLDRDQYQPWVAQYPSALPLQIVGGRIAKALVELHARYRFPRACVIAHSMGGLVAREVVRTLPSDVPVRGLATIASPLGGVHSATAGVRWSPAVVPSWRDIAPGSPFLRGLYEPSLPRAVPYYLLFAFSEGESSDGVVEIASQLRSEAQEEAEVIRGFAGTHTGVLESEDVQRVLSRFLNRCSISDDGGLGRIGKEED